MLPPEILERYSPQQLKAFEKAITHKAWAEGHLWYKFHDTQQRIYDAINAHESSQFYLLCSRRLGKTFMLLSMAFEVCIRKPGARVLFLAPTAKNAAEIAQDTASVLSEDCPPKLRPEFKAQSKEFVFRHLGGDSILRLKGVNSETAQDLRGTSQDLIILDECGQYDELEEVLYGICLPMILTTQGRVLLATTPPLSPGHASAAVYEKLSRVGASVRFTLNDAPHIPYADKRKTLLQLGEAEEDVDRILRGEIEPRTTKALREYYCRFVTDSEQAVLPEFNEAARKQIIVPWTRPSHFDAYVAMDPGVVDNTGVLFAYYDFLSARLVVEDELLLTHVQANTPEIAKAIKAKELELWRGQPPYRRVSDVEKRLISDLRRYHELEFHQTKKNDNEAAIHLMRDWIAQRKLVISPKCVNLIRQLENVTWNRKGTDFQRAGDIDAHYDLVSALKYMIRNVDRQRNPYPSHYYEAGGRLGPPVGTWQTPGVKRKGGLSLRGKTPVARKLGTKKPGFKGR